jgi:hypothetical protein
VSEIHKTIIIIFFAGKHHHHLAKGQQIANVVYVFFNTSVFPNRYEHDMKIKMFIYTRKHEIIPAHGAMGSPTQPGQKILVLARPVMTYDLGLDLNIEPDS